MSLLFAIDGDKVLHNSVALGTILDGTIMMWVYATDDTARQILCNHFSTPDYGLGWRADAAGDNFNCNRQRGTTYVNAQAAAANFTNYGLNKWMFIAGSFSTTTAGENRLLIGDTTAKPAEPSAYVAQTAGAGTISQTNADFYVGLSSVSTREFHGKIASIHVCNVVLSVAQIIEQWSFLHKISSTVLLCEYGLDGVGTQKDQSGFLTNGTVTTATVDTHPVGTGVATASRNKFNKNQLMRPLKPGIPR